MVFRQAWVTIALLVTLVGIGLREPSVAAVGILVLLTGGLARAWNRLALERVLYRRTLGSRRAFVGETVEVRFSVTNRKVLPLHWLEILDNMPESLPTDDARVSPSGFTVLVSVLRSVSLAWYQWVAWRMRFLCTARGHYRFGPATLHAGDPFGFFESRREVGHTDWITVLPRLYDLSA